MVSHKPRGGAPAPLRSVPKRGAVTLRPPARVQRIALFEREVRERLSPSALDLLFGAAEVISEGQRTTRSGREVYLGSTMLTIDLATLGRSLRDPPDAGTARRCAALLGSDPGARARVQELAGREVARVTGLRPRTVNTEMIVTHRGAKVFVDVDVEASL